MPIRFEFNSNLNILITRAEGCISYEEVIKHLDSEGKEKYLGKPELFNALDASTDVTPGQVREIVSHLLRLMRDHVLGPTAIVTRDLVLFGMCRMLQIISDLENGPEFGVYQTAEEGMEWLRGPHSGSRSPK